MTRLFALGQSGLSARRALRQAGEQRITVAASVPKALVRIAWPGDDMYDIGQTRRLNLLAQCFSERLRKKIREELGAAYSPNAWYAPGEVYRGNGWIQASIGVAPAQVAVVITATRALADDPHFGPYMAIPGKDNGFDIEGLAVDGHRLLLGLRDVLEASGPLLSVLASDPSVAKPGADLHAELQVLGARTAAVLAGPGADKSRLLRAHCALGAFFAGWDTCFRGLTGTPAGRVADAELEVVLRAALSALGEQA